MAAGRGRRWTWPSLRRRYVSGSLLLVPLSSGPGRAASERGLLHKLSVQGVDGSGRWPVPENSAVAEGVQQRGEGQWGPERVAWHTMLPELSMVPPLHNTLQRIPTAVCILLWPSPHRRKFVGASAPAPTHPQVSSLTCATRSGLQPCSPFVSCPAAPLAPCAPWCRCGWASAGLSGGWARAVAAHAATGLPPMACCSLSPNPPYLPKAPTPAHPQAQSCPNLCLPSPPPQGAARAFSAAATNGDTDGTILRGSDGHILPHGGGALVNLMAGNGAAEEARRRCQYSVELTERQVGAGRRRWAAVVGGRVPANARLIRGFPPRRTRPAHQPFYPPLLPALPPAPLPLPRPATWSC